MESQIYLFGGLGALLMGATLGIFGAGGSILTVPLLVFLFQLPASMATQYSLLIVGLVSAFGLVRDRKGEKLPILDLSKFALPAMLGMFLMRRFFLPALPKSFVIPVIGMFSLDNLILMIFAFFMIAASFSMIFVKIKSDRSPAMGGWRQTAALAVVGALVGLATGLVGAGGGFLIVPALVFLAKFSVPEAARASLFVIMLNSLWGFFSGGVVWDQVPWAILTLVISSAFAGMMLGLWLRGHMKADKLKPAFGIFVLLMGSYVLWRSF